MHYQCGVEAARVSCSLVFDEIVRVHAAQVYDGEWWQGRHHGQGSMRYGAGNQYKGQWKLGKKNGLGTMTYPDGAR